MEARALVVTLADAVADAKAWTPCITVVHIKPKVLNNKLASTLVQGESDTLGDTGGS